MKSNLHRIPYRILLCIFVILLTAVVAPRSLAAMDLNCANAVVVDVETGQILYGKNPYTQAPCGDFGKMLNIITALEFDDAPQELVVTANAIKIDPEPPYLGLTAGQIVTLSDMLYAEYLGGYNDAANVVAENLGQTLLDTESAEYIALSDFKKSEAAINAYVKEMNKMAAKLRATSMKVTNADGHFYDTQQCSPLDMARVIQYGLENDTFAKLLTHAEKEITVASSGINSRQADYKDKKKREKNSGEEDSDGEESDNEDEAEAADSTLATSTAEASATGRAGRTELKTTHQLLNGAIAADGIIGGINAYNKNLEKYHTMACAEKDGRTLVAVAMDGDETLVYNDVQSLLEFGFYNWSTVTLEEKDVARLVKDKIAAGDFAFSGNFDILLPEDRTIEDLDAALAYTENGYISGTVTLTLPEEEDYAGPITTISFYEKNENGLTAIVIKVLIALGLIVVVTVFALLLRRGSDPRKAKHKAILARVRKTSAKEKEKFRQKASSARNAKSRNDRGKNPQDAPFTDRYYVNKREPSTSPKRRPRRRNRH